MARAVGIGGVFLRAQDPVGLLAWYAEALGFAVDDHGGSATFTEAVGATAVLATFPADTDDLGPSGQGAMLNLRVDDLAGCLEQVAAAGGTVDPERMDEPYGAFGWFTDPEGNRVELWEPRDG